MCLSDDPDGGGYIWMVVEGESGRTVVVDPGGPAISAAELASAVAKVSGIEPVDDDRLVAVVPPPPPPLSASCLAAPQGAWVERCPVSESTEVYLTDYLASLERLLATVEVPRDEGIDVLGASYAAARWAMLEARTHDDAMPQVDSAVFVSPLGLGLSADALWESQRSAAGVIWHAALFEDCDSAQCLGALPLGRVPTCGSRCDPFVHVRDVTGLRADIVERGLTGLAVHAPENAPRLRASLAADGDIARDMIRQGAASFDGTDPFGSPHVTTIAFLAGVCPALSPSTTPAAYPLGDCQPLTSDWSSELKRFELPGVGPAVVCYLSTQPDPVLGNASLRGLTGVGQRFGSTTVSPSVFGHGDLSLGLPVLSDHRSADWDGDACGRFGPN